MPADFQVLFESVPGCVLVLAPDRPRFTILAATEGYLRETKTRREEILGRGIFEVFPDNPDQPASSGNNARASFERVLERRSPDTMAVQQHDIPRPESGGGGFEERYWSPVNTPVLDGSGEVRYILHCVENVTDFVRLKAERRAGEALRQSEERLRALADSMPQLAWTAQPDGYITWYNHRWYEYTGTTPRQMEGWGWQSVHDPARLPDVLLRWKESISSGTAFEMEFPLRGADGEFRRFLTRVFPLRDQGGKVLQWFGTNTDVTEFVEAQEVLREASRLKDDFLSMASHELRTPLTTLRLHAETLGRSLRKAQVADERVERKLAAMDSQCDRLEGLVHTLLDVSRITAGKLVLELTPCDLGELTREVVERFEAQAESAGSELRLSTREVVGRWDRARVDQVITNLVSNAIKYGDGQPVDVAVGERDGAAVLVIRDHGVGIVAESHARIFERFERAASSSAASGLGLGLWIARQMVRAHGGDIAVESAPGAGATFTVTLPRTPP